MHPFNARYDRPAYIGPSCDVPSADNVGVFGVAAACAAELGLRAPVPLVAMAAQGARPAGVPRINEHDWYARESGLVLDECAKLPECPRMQDGPLAPANGDPATDVLEFFKRNRASGVSRLADQRLADHVVFVGREPSLATREFF